MNKQWPQGYEKEQQIKPKQSKWKGATTIKGKTNEIGKENKHLYRCLENKRILEISLDNTFEKLNIHVFVPKHNFQLIPEEREDLNSPKSIK